jgi:hypothetical protein
VQPGLISAQDADLEVRLPFRPGRRDLAGGAEHESEPAVVPRVAQQRGEWLAEGVSRAQDGMHERAADAVPLVVRPHGQRADREDRVLADVPARSSSISLASGTVWPGGRRRANAAVVMARMTSASRVVSRRISTRAR